MLIRIRGNEFDAGAPYVVCLDGSEDELVAGMAELGITGPVSVYGTEVLATDPVSTKLVFHDGQEASITPTGPVTYLSSDDPQSVLAWLNCFTQVVSVEGLVPETIKIPNDPNVVY